VCRAGAGIGRRHTSAGRRPVVVGHTCKRLLGLTYDARYTTLLESETSMRKRTEGAAAMTTSRQEGSCSGALFTRTTLFRVH